MELRGKMVSLREDFNKHKTETAKAINEAAVQWITENVLLLNEGFNRESLQKLQGAISKFDSAFAPFGSKVPEVQKSLDDTVELMNRITMGDNITKKDGKLKLSKEESESIKEPATYVVKYLSILYNNLSRFFNKDMPALLEFPLFKIAKQNGEVPLKDLADSDKMKKAILNALIPSKQTTEILKRMYRTMDLPSLDYGTIADQILNLSVNDFGQLMQVDKVPLLASVDKAPITSQTPEPVAQEAATSTNLKGSEGDLSEEDGLLKEIGEVNQGQLESISSGITKIKEVVRTFPELTNTNRALDQLIREAQTVISQGGVINSQRGKVIVATANSVYSYFETLGKLWPQYSKLLPDSGALDQQQIANVKAFLQKAQGGIVAKISNFFKAKVAPGLSPVDISNEIISVVEAGQQAAPGSSGGEQTSPTGGATTGGVESLKNFFNRLSSLKLQPNLTPSGEPQAAATPAAQPTQPTGGSTNTATAAPATQGSAAAQPAQTSATAQQPQQAGAGTTDTKGLAAAMGKAIGVNGNNPEFVKQVENLVGAGWKITPPSSTQ